MVPATMVAPDETGVVLPQGVTLSDAITAIATEQDCSADRARMTIKWMREVVVSIKQDGCCYHPQTSEMNGPAYQLFHELIPHSGSPTPAGEVMLDYLLGTNRGKQTLRHFGPGHGNNLEACEVAIYGRSQ